jgi:hypothetical protein
VSVKSKLANLVLKPRTQLAGHIIMPIKHRRSLKRSGSANRGSGFIIH